MALTFRPEDHLPGGKKGKQKRVARKKAVALLIPGQGKQSFTIVVDSREQRPYEFADMAVRGLKHGDYSVGGMEGLVVIERKSMQDLHGSLTHGRERFRRECEALAKYSYAAIVIEGDYFELLAPVKHSKASPESIVASVLSWSVRYGLPVFFVGNRVGGQDLIYRLLNQVVRLYNKGEFPGGRCAKGQTR